MYDFPTVRVNMTWYNSKKIFFKNIYDLISFTCFSIYHTFCILIINAKDANVFVTTVFKLLH